MPYFPEQNLLFIHIPKNAGRSVEKTLLGDQLTPDSGRRNIISRAATFIQRSVAQGCPRSHLLGTLDYTLMAQHLTYAEIQLLNLVPRESISSLKVFCVVRNPFDRVLSSLNHWAHILQPELGSVGVKSEKDVENLLTSWEQFSPLDHNEISHTRLQCEFIKSFYSDWPVPEIIRFEDITNDFERYCRQNGLRFSTLEKVGASRGDGSFRELFSSRSRALVERLYGADLLAFDYSF